MDVDSRERRWDTVGHGVAGGAYVPSHQPLQGVQQPNRIAEDPEGDAVQFVLALMARLVAKQPPIEQSCQ